MGVVAGSWTFDFTTGLNPIHKEFVETLDSGFTQITVMNLSEESIKVGAHSFFGDFEECELVPEMDEAIRLMNAAAMDPDKAASTMLKLHSTHTSSSPLSDVKI